MKTIRLFSFFVLITTVLGTTADATPVNFLFTGTDSQGTGSAKMSVDITGSTLTIQLDNTSPIVLNDGSGDPNAPGIVGFGFDLTNAPLLLGWDLVDHTSTSVVGTGNNKWQMGTSRDGVSRDFLPQTQGVKGAFYNPLATAGFAAPPHYFTTATLTMNFGAAPVLDQASPYVRMQNVGAGGAGSLKLPGTPSDPIPEPSTYALLLLGLGGLAAFHYQRRRSDDKQSTEV